MGMIEKALVCILVIATIIGALLGSALGTRDPNNLIVQPLGMEFKEVVPLLSPLLS